MALQLAGEDFEKYGRVTQSKLKSPIILPLRVVVFLSKRNNLINSLIKCSQLSA
jgi:hypothetical protein